MSKFKNFLFLPLLLLLALGVVAACGQDDDGVVRLEYWIINSDPIRLPVMESHVRAFNESQDRIYVNFTPIPQDDALNRLNVAITAGEQPDISDLLHGWVAGLVLRGELYELDGMYNNWAGRNEMVPALIQEIRNLDQANGRLHMLPATSNTHTIWVRNDWLAEQGITNQLEWTWDDFFNAVEAMTDPSQVRFGHTIRGGAGSAPTLFEMIHSYSGEPTFENGIATINRPHNVAFVQRYFDLFLTHAPESGLTAGHMEITADFGAGIAGSMIHNLGSHANHVEAFDGNENMYQAIPMPYSRLGTRNLSTSVHGFAVLANTAHPAEAFEFISFMVNEQNNSEWNETIGQLPSNVGVMGHNWFNDATHIATMTSAVNSPVTTSNGMPQFLPMNASINTNVAAPSIQEALTGSISVQELLDRWANALTEELADFTENVLGN